MAAPPPHIAGEHTAGKPSDPALDQTEPHGALFLVLAYLRLPELLACWRVCHLFRDAIAEDRLIWERIAVEPPLSGRLTDDTLLDLTTRARGKLRSLALHNCWNITDAGLLRVADQNPTITELYVPGCTHLTADGIIKVVQRIAECKGNLKRLQLHGLPNIRRDHIDTLNSYLCKNNPEQFSQLSAIRYYGSVPFSGGDRRPLDIEICPKCKNVGLVFDCTREDCRLKKNHWIECRGCFFCIARCEECGGCVDFKELGEETICSHLLCLECWLLLPKCNMCNRAYCRGHSKFQQVSSKSAGFVCELCSEDGSLLYRLRMH